MDAKLFSCGETVLLIGEGNFSFTVGLEKLNWSLKITSSCYEAQDLQGDSTSSEKCQNIKYLVSRGVRVLLGVDGTQLSKHPILGCERFSKIIFNFPHVGGKMKINLNRCLLRDFLKSAASLLEPGGKVLVSLAKGQGGTDADVPQRRWDDTWKVVEMAAHSDLVLSGIKPFLHHLVPNYSSVGYRSRDESFHTDGALVHVFSKVNPVHPNAFTYNPSLLLECLEQQSIKTNFGKVTCPSIYAVKYNCNPADIEDSPVHYLCQKLNSFAEDQLKNSEFTNLNIKHISDVEIPLHVEVCDGSYVCEKKDQVVRCELRHSLLDVIGEVLPFWTNRSEEIVIFSGLVFNKLGSNFSVSPLANHVLILGGSVCNLGLCYVQHLLTLVKDCSFECFLEKSVEPCEVLAENSDTSLETLSMAHIVISTKNTNDQHQKNVIVGEELSLIVRWNNKLLTVPCSLVYLDKLALVLFKLHNWRELWAHGVHLVVNKGLGLPLLKLPSLYHRSFTFDICFGSEASFDSKSFYDILWQMAGDMVTNVELLNLYESPDGTWRSSCYRIVYQSFDNALYREKVIAIHQNVIGRTVCKKLGVTTN